MNKSLSLIMLLLAATMAAAAAQDTPGVGTPAPVVASPVKQKTKLKHKANPNAPILVRNPRAKGNGADDDAPPLVVNRLRLHNPILVYYQQATPGKGVQQLIMSEDHLALLRYLSPDQLVERREVFVDGLSNLSLPGMDENKYRLLGTSVLADEERHPAGDGRSTYSKLKVPSSAGLYMVRESAEEYRHFVKGPKMNGAMLDFQVNVLPGVDSVRAVYTLRRMKSSERGAGTGATIR